MDYCILANIGIYFKTEYFKVSRIKVHSNNLQEAHVKKWLLLQFYYASCYHILENQLNFDKIVSFWAWRFSILNTICSHTADGILQKNFTSAVHPHASFTAAYFSLCLIHAQRQTLALNTWWVQLFPGHSASQASIVKFKSILSICGDRFWALFLVL